MDLHGETCSLLAAPLQTILLFMLGMSFYYRHHKIMKASQVVFLQIIVVMGMIACG